MRKVGIVSCYFKNNYGSQLQAFATQKIIQEMGYETETIEVEKNIDFKNGKKAYYKKQLTNIAFIKSKLGMIKLKLYIKINKKLRKNIAIRNIKFNEFKKIYQMSNSYITNEELSQMSKKYSSVVVGSDQLWLPVNVEGNYYTLNWVPDNINKISYSTSFGVSNIPEKYKEKYKYFLNRINFLSTREDVGVKLIKELTDREAKLVCDPTLLFNKEEWMCIQEEKPIYDEKYILCYFLGNNIEHRKFAEKLKKKTGYKIISINHCDEYVKYSDKFADIIPYDIGPKEFLNLLRNAQYICTDSFHGTVFSLINNKEFFTFRRYKNKSKVSTNSRILSLLNKVSLENRLIYGTEDVGVLLNQKIDYKKVNKSIEEFRSYSKNYLKTALEHGDNEESKEKFIKIEEKANCCGCTACKSICPKNAISMIEDEEGFLYPEVDKEKCINCGLCKKVCPILNKKRETAFKQKAYIVNNKNEMIRKESTSGGAFTEIAKYILNKNGVIFGASFDKDFNVKHTFIEKEEDLKKFRGSKYVQSNLEDTFRKTEKFLKENRYVCFSGTPCQIEGLKRFLGKDYNNLITVDIVCRAVPSPKYLRRYLKYINNNKAKGKIKRILFRDKSKYGYQYSTMTIETDKVIYQNGVESDAYLRAFFNDLSDRPCCYNCAFKKQYRESDFTIWDCFTVEDFNKK